MRVDQSKNTKFYMLPASKLPSKVSKSLQVTGGCIYFSPANLRWSKHIQEITAKANSTLCTIRRNVKKAPKSDSKSTKLL